VVLKRLARYVQVTDRLRGFLDKALTPADVVRAKREGRHALCLTTNAVPLVRQGVSAEDELRALRTFFQLGVRMMHLTYNRRNLLGDGCAEAANGGLSDFGRAVIAEMNRLGLLVDVAHSGWQTSLEAARASARPIVASHTVCAALNPHARAKPDEVIRAIVDGGGLVGICAIPAFLGGNGDITALLDHVDYVKRTFGADAVAIGTDVSASLSLPEADRAPARALAAARPKARPKFENFWRPDEPMNRPEWNRPEQHLSLSWLNFPCFTVGMVQRGYADDDIRKILGGNMLRVLEAVLPEPEKRRLV